MLTAKQGGPDPAAARTPEEFVELLREIRTRSGLSFWEIQRHAYEQGYELEPAIVVHALGQPTLPDWQIVVGLLVSCGYQGMEIDRWMRVYHDLAEAGPQHYLPEQYQPEQYQPEQEFDDEPAEAPPLPRGRRRAAPSRLTRRNALFAAGAAAVFLLTLVIVKLWDGESGPPSTLTLPSASPQESADTGWPTEDPATPSPEATANVLASPLAGAGVLRTGTVTLASGQGVDLDTGQTSGRLDIVAASGTALEAADRAKRLSRVSGTPSQQTCQSLNLGQLDRDATGLAIGQWLCVRTSSGRWARLNITATGASLKLVYTVWT